MFIKNSRPFPPAALLPPGEHFTGDPSTFDWFLDQTGRRMSLFDFPLYFNMRAASERGGDYDMRNILNNTLVQRSPAQAVTFVDNHDTFREQTREVFRTGSSLSRTRRFSCASRTTLAYSTGITSRSRGARTSGVSLIRCSPPAAIALIPHPARLLRPPGRYRLDAPWRWRSSAGAGRGHERRPRQGQIHVRRPA